MDEKMINKINDIIELNKDYKQENLLLQKEILQLQEKLFDYEGKPSDKTSSNDKENDEKNLELIGTKEVAYEELFNDEDEIWIKNKYTKKELLASNSPNKELRSQQSKIFSKSKNYSSHLIEMLKTLHLENYTEAFKVGRGYKFTKKDVLFINNLWERYNKKTVWKVLKEKEYQTDSFLIVYKMASEGYKTNKSDDKKIMVQKKTLI